MKRDEATIGHLQKDLDYVRQKADKLEKQLQE